MLSPVSWDSSILGTPIDRNELINHRLWIGNISLHRDPVGKHGGRGATLPGTLRDFFDIHSCVPFLDPEDVTNLSIGSIWNTGKGTGYL